MFKPNPFSGRKHLDQIPQLGIHIRKGRHGLGHLGADEFAETLAQAMDRDLERALAPAELGSDIRLGRRRANQSGLQPLELLGFACRCVFLRQQPQRAVHDGQRPLAIEPRLGKDRCRRGEFPAR